MQLRADNEQCARMGAIGAAHNEKRVPSLQLRKKARLQGKLHGSDPPLRGALLDARVFRDPGVGLRGGKSAPLRRRVEGVCH